jgi:hypothetical protein
MTSGAHIQISAMTPQPGTGDGPGIFTALNGTGLPPSAF